MISPSTSRPPKSSAWRPCCIPTPRRASRSSNAYWVSPCATRRRPLRRADLLRPLTPPVHELEQPCEQFRGARLVGVHEEFLLHAQTRHDDRRLRALLANPARAVARAEAGGLGAAHRQL